MASPRFKVYNEIGDYEASTKSPEDAAAIIGGIGCEGWSIRDGHRHLVWAEGKEEVRAGESYDEVARIVWERCLLISTVTTR